ncbi:MAG: hypothetical protein DMG21_10940 [Acidobacteria bacterium]|nr:MAG: hypothetical protein DMG21_10940 [Acidobacteriota bacterium]
MAIAIPIAFSGKSSGGAAFKENTRTITINRQGAKVATMQALTLGAEVLIENRHLGTSARANVVWLGERKGPKDSVEIGVQLVEASNIWGIEFPPEDWQEGSPAKPAPGAGARLDSKLPPPAPAKAPEVAAPAPGPKETGIPRPAVTAPPAPKAAPLASAATATAAVPARPGGLVTAPPQQIQAAITAALEQLNAQTETTLEGHAKNFEARLARFGQEMGFQSQAQLQQAANALEQKLTAALDEKVKALRENLTASRSEFESLLERYRGLQESGAREAEKIKQSVEAAGFAAAQSALEQVSGAVAKELQGARHDFVEGTRQRVDEAAVASLEKFNQQVSPRLGQLSDESIQRLEVRMRVEEARALEQAAKAVDAATAAGLRALEEKSAERMEGFQGYLEKVAKKAQEKTAKELSDQLGTASDELIASASKDLQKNLSEARAALKDELKTAWKPLVEDAKKQLGSMTSTTVESLNKEAKVGLEEFRGHLKKSVEETIERAARELESELRKNAGRQASSAFDELRGKTQEAVRQASDAVNKHVGSGAVFLKELEERAQERLEALSEKMESLVRASQSDLEQNAAEFSTAAMEGMRASSDALAERFHQRLQKSADEFAAKLADDIQPRMEGITEKLVEESAALLSKQSREDVELASAELERLKSKLVDETEEAIRARLAETFSSVFMPGGRRITDKAAEQAQKKP